MKKLFRLTTLMVVAAILVIGVSCVKKDDFNDLKSQVSKNTEDIQKLKDLTNLLDQAIQNGELISSVRTVTKTVGTQTINGIEIVFTGNGGTKTIWDGSNGVDGIDGKDGVAVTENTPYAWINTNGNWAMNTGSIPADSDNEKYELKFREEGRETSIPAYIGEGTDIHPTVNLSFKSVDGKVVIHISNPLEEEKGSFDIPTTIDSKLNEKSLQGVVTYDQYYIFIINGQEYKVLRKVVRPTAITLLAQSLYIEKGKTASFNIKVSPSNAEFCTSQLSLDFVESMSRSAGTVISNPSFVEIDMCQSVLVEDVQNGEYTVTLNWLDDMDKHPRINDYALFVVINTFDEQNQEYIAITSATPLYLTEKFIPIRAEYFETMPDIVMFQGETYQGDISLAMTADDKYIWDRGYVSTTAITNTPGTYATSKILTTDKFGYEVTAPVAPVIAPGTNQTSTATVTIKDIAKPVAGAINPTFGIKVYPVPVNGILYAKTDVAPAWIPHVAVSNHVDFNLNSISGISLLNQYGFYTSVWDFACTKIDYSFNGGVLTTVPETITTYPENVAAYRFNIDLKPEIMYGKHKLVYNVKATAKAGERIGLPKTVTFKVTVEFDIYAPVFHIELNTFKTDTSKYEVLSGRGTYTTVRNQAVPMTNSLSEVFDVAKNKNVSDEVAYKPNAALPKSPSYEYYTGSRNQGLMMRPSGDVAVNWTGKTSVEFYSKLITGQEIPVKVEGYLATAKAGVVDIVFAKHPLNTVHTTAFAISYEDLKQGRIKLNLKNPVYGDLYGVDASGKRVHWTCIESIGYAVKNITMATTPPGMPTQLIRVAADGTVTALGDTTWNNDTPATQPIEIEMTDIWGNSKKTTLNITIYSATVAPIL